MSEEVVRATAELLVGDLIRSTFASRPADSSGPTVATVTAVSFVADVSGYTAMADLVSKREKGGADRLSAAMNQFFGPLIRAVIAQGGDITDFTGDGLQAVWVTDDDLAEADLVRALSAARSALAELEGLEVAAGLGIRLRIGISIGPVACAIVGGVGDRWLAIVAGSGLSEADRAQQEGRPGEIILATAAARLVGDRVTGAPTRSGALRVHWSAPPDDIPPRDRDGAAGAPVDQLLSGSAAALLAAGATLHGEIRSASLLFSHLPAAAGDLRGIHDAAVTLQQVAARFDGVVESINVEEKGVYGLAAWGLSVQTHDDDPVRAVAAARAMSDELGGGVGVGVATGRVFHGVIGPPERRTYGVVSRVANVAARLMQAAGRGVLVDGVTRSRARHSILFEPVPGLHLKGIEGAVTAYRPLQRRSEHRQPGHFAVVGRDPEQRLLEEAIERLETQGASATFVIEAQPGMGKSVLLVSVRDSAGGSAGRLVELAGDALESTVPYHAWHPAFRRLLGPSPFDRAAQLLPDVDEAQLGLLGDVLGIPAPPRTASAMTLETRVDVTRRLATSLLARLTSGLPLVLLVDDAHWLDGASWELLLDVIGEIPAILTVIATRGMERAMPDDSVLLRLGLLDRAGSIALMADRLDTDNLSPQLIEAVWSRAEGHPMFTDEMVRAMRDQGVVTVVGAEREATLDQAAWDTTNLPHSVAASIAGRLARLGIPDQRTLTVASVLGRAFDPEIVAAIHPDGAGIEQVVSCLEQAATHDLVERLETGEFRFTHILIGQVAEARLPLLDRRQLHAAAATALQERAAAPARVAYHLLEAGQDREALGRLEAAGRQALEAGANADAITHLRRAVEIGGDEVAPERAATWHRLLAAATRGQGDVTGTRRNSERAAELLAVPVPASTSRLVAGLAGQLLVQARHRVLPPRRYQGPKAERRVAQAEATYDMTFTAFSQADTLRLFYNGVRSANLAERAAPSSVEARALSFLMYGSGLAGMHRLSASYHARALVVADRADAPVARAEVLLNRGVLLATIGAWDPALQELSVSRQAYEALGEQHGIRQVIGVENFVNVHRCRLDEARKTASQLRRLAEEADDAVHQSWGGLSLALQSVLLGGYEDAVAACEDLRPVVERSAEVPSMLNRLGILALASWRVGRLDVTGRHLEEAAALVAKVSPLATVHAYDPFWMLAELAMAIWDAKDTGGALPAGMDAVGAADTVIRPLLRQARTTPIARPMALVVRGHLARRSGKTARAVKMWRRAVADAENLQMPYVVMRGLLDLGRFSGDPPGEIAALDRAAELSDACRIEWVSARAAEELRLRGA